MSELSAPRETGKPEPGEYPEAGVAAKGHVRQWGSGKQYTAENIQIERGDMATRPRAHPPIWILTYYY